MKYLHALLLVAGIWLATECAITVHYARQRSVYTFDQLNKVLRESSQTMDEVRKAATIWREASKEQSSQTTVAMISLKDSAARLSRFVTRTDSSLNAVLFPEISVELKKQSDSLLKSQEDLQENLSRISSATSQAQKLLVDADAQINNPDVKIALDNVATSSANLATATNEAAASMKTIHAGLDYELHQLEAPVTKVRAALNLSLLVIRRLFF